MIDVNDTRPGGSSWNPANGCFPCPVDLGDASGIRHGINPLPMFQDLGRAYYSVPLGTFYLPATRVFTLDPSVVVTSVDARRIHDLLGIWFHEEAHYLFNGSTAKLQIQLAAAEAWENLGALLEGPLEPAHWRALQECNEVINALCKHIALIEELYVTFHGILIMRKYEPPDIVDEVEERFVSNHQQTFPAFSTLYEDIGYIHSRLGLTPITMLTHFSQDLVYIDPSDPNHGWLVLENLENRSSLGRFLDGMIALRALISADVRADSWSMEKWTEFYAGCLPEFGEWINTRADVIHILERGLQASASTWIPQLNPTSGLLAVREGVRHMNFARIARTAPGGDANDEETRGEEADKFVLAMLDFVRKYDWEAGGRTRELVSLLFGKGEGLTDDVLYFVKHGDGAEGEITPVSCVVLGDGNPDEEKVRRSMKIDALLLYEGLRSQIASKRGVRCPLFRSQISTVTGRPVCCGMFRMVERVYELGKWAKENAGFEPEIWELPSECGCDIV